MIKIRNYNENQDAFFFTYDNDLISDRLQKGQIWEKWLHEIFEKYINKESVVIEAGCHIGCHSIKLGMLAKTVYCFEPLPSSFNLLKQNVDYNGLDSNVIISQFGLSDKIGETYFSWVTQGNIGYAGLHPMVKPSFCEEPTEKIKVELTTIDDMNLEQLDFIKLDVEGYEPFVLQGGIETIKKFKPVITLECWKDYFGTVDVKFTEEKYKFLIDIGYKMEHIKDSDFLFTPI